MKHIVFLIALFCASKAFGQELMLIDTTKSGVELHEEAKAHLSMENSRVFDKLLALAKFRESHRLISLDTVANASIQKENREQIQNLAAFFIKAANRDSLLQTTRFYPDSVFQANPQYAPRFKTLLTQLLDFLRNKRRKDYLIADGLIFKNPPAAADSLLMKLEFDNYWPLEVIEIDRTLQERENNLAALPKRWKDELLYAVYKNELDSLQYQSVIQSLNLNNQYIRNQEASASQGLQQAQRRYNTLRKVTIGTVVLLVLLMLFIKRKSDQMLNSKNQIILEEKKRSEELLLNILPAEVAKELKSQAAVKAQRHETSSVLFSDFEDFSKIANNLSPEELVRELDYCFTAFDRIFDKYHLQKIKTIGDSYMCAGGLYTKGTNHVARMIIAALEIQQFLAKLKKARQAAGKHFYEARIGIHTGPVVAGIVGTKKFAFDIWGDTVNVAQQMEAHSEVGKVNISGETFELVKDQFVCTFRGTVVAKNTKEFKMYYVDGLIGNTG